MTEKTNWDFIDRRKIGETKKTGEEKPETDHPSVDELTKQMNDGLEKQGKEIARQEYEEAKSAAKKFREEHQIQKSEEELAQEDAMLRTKFGIKD